MAIQPFSPPSYGQTVANIAKITVGAMAGAALLKIAQTLGKNNRPQTAQKDSSDVSTSLEKICQNLDEIRAKENQREHEIQELNAQLVKVEQKLLTAQTQLRQAHSELDEKHATELDVLVRIWQKQVDAISSPDTVPRNRIEKLQTEQQGLFASWYRQHELLMRSLRALCAGKLPPDTTPVPTLESLTKDYLIFEPPIPPDPPSVSAVFVIRPEEE